MAIKERNYFYPVLRDDNLRKIAEKHGMPPTDGREVIWEHDNNAELHTKAIIPGQTRDKDREVKRQLYLEKEYIEYKHSEHTGKGEVILYVNERIWIPLEEEEEEEEATPEKIKREITKKELKQGFYPKKNTEYELIFPVLRVRIEVDPEDINEEEKYTLFSSEDNGASYKMELSVKDGIVQEDLTDLHFCGVITGEEYTLEFDPGKDGDGNAQEPYYLFENQIFDG